MSSPRAQAFAFLGRHLLEAKGQASREVRAAAMAGQGEGALGEYAALVQAAAYQVTPEQVDALRRAHDDDALFEVTVCAAYGAAKLRHEKALAVLDAAWEDA